MAPVTVTDFLGAALSLAAFAADEISACACWTHFGDQRAAAGPPRRALERKAQRSAGPGADAHARLLLDEPVSGMDAEGLASFYHTLDSLRCDFDISILLISHDFAFVRQYADRAVLLHHRVLSHGLPETVFQSDAFSALFPGYAGTEEEA